MNIMRSIGVFRCDVGILAHKADDGMNYRELTKVGVTIHSL